MHSFTIITPSFNQAPYLGRTAASILGQAGDVALQWLVIDGGSTDGTIELLRSIADPRLSWISEPDRGQANAINKGLARAAGEFIGWVNSDDLLADGALSAVAAAFAENPAAQWLVGRCDIVDADDRPIRAAITRYKDRGLHKVSFRHLLRENPISQPAVFWRRSFGEGLGPLDESLHHVMDYDLWLRMARASKPMVLDRLLAHFRLHSASKSGQEDRGRFAEQYAVASRYFGADRWSRVVHICNVEKIVWSYRLLRLMKK
ncbi:MAG TPA: glycosyltransferase family 2 protein [Tepidisphaeraceae bacterium]|jgi:glycosyltransferase involved in cell wall biosynthesis|nr:glycosyltransferase family 2 protein [Tepidisphaeraceae bacterium]